MKHSPLSFGDKHTRPAPLIAALVFVALVPAVGVLWFMSVAMRNERLAVQEQMTAVYLNHLASLQPRVTAWVKERQAALQAVNGNTPPEIFAAAVRAGLADGILVRDATGKLLYPAAAPVEPVANENSELARTLLAQAAAFLQAGEKQSALAKLNELTSNPNLRRATGAHGVLLVPDTQLLILKTLSSASNAVPQPMLSRNGGTTSVSSRETARTEPGPPSPANDLIARLNDYSDPDLGSDQRRFLMREVQALAPEAAHFPMLEAEELSAEFIEHESIAGFVKSEAPPTRVAASASEPMSDRSLALAATGIRNVWKLPSADRTVVALFREERLRAEIAAAVATPPLADARVTVLAPLEAASADKRVPAMDASELLPGWRLSLSFNGPDPLALASARQSRFYLWSGFLVVLVIAVVALLVARYVSAQMRLARMKDELVSTVSHELKTPLTAMRALLETLSAGRYRDATQMQRYLHLTTKENLRLSHLIDNFLVFSRLSRGQQQFRFTALAPSALLRTALDAVGEKLTSPPCRLSTHLAPDLPPVRGDADALATVLVNLLDNAYKYTNHEKKIAVSVSVEGGHVVFAVADNGIGIPPEQQTRIFERFYQADQSLTRQRGGCGLGLSIVQSIVQAHDGVVEAQSVPGQGSTFRVRIPQATLNDQLPTLDARVANHASET